MTQERPDDDRDLRELFLSARRAESRGAPGFEVVVRSKSRDGVPGPAWWPRLAVALPAAGALGVALLAAGWLLDPWSGAKSGPSADLTARLAESPTPGGKVEPSSSSGTVDNEPRTSERMELASPSETPPPPQLRSIDPDTAAADTPRTAVRSGGISVRVLAPGGTPLPDATVTISHPLNYVPPFATLTNGTGEARFPVLRSTDSSSPGYTIEASFPGLASIQLRDVEVPSGETTTQPIQLAEEIVERALVVAKADVVEFQQTASCTRFTDTFVQDLPVPGRFHQNVLTLASGVQDADGDGNPNVHGARLREFRALVGGVSNVSTDTPELRIREEPWNAEGYRAIEENPFLDVGGNPLSTFSIDVDTASYSNVRRFLASGSRPPADAVRIEEMINYFDYDYPAPVGGAPFSTDVEIVDCPWNPAHRLARIGIKGREMVRGEHAGSNLVFLLDVSGSMDHPSKLPLLKAALRLLVDQLASRDQVAIVVYAGSSGLVLDSTSGDAKQVILDALDRLDAGGSTNGGAGLELAYRVARENFIPGGINRVILATDGDFNIGVTGHSALLKSIEKDAGAGIFLTALGFGYGNYQDDRLEHLADKGNGNYAYIDRLSEARKVLVEELSGTLFTIAKDVKIQVEFNPLEIGAYRLIGYENRLLRKEDFNDDRKDAGEIGAGHTVTALYELVAPGRVGQLSGVDPLRYQTPTTLSYRAESGESFTVKLRYKEPDGETSQLLSFPIVDDGRTLTEASADVRFAAAVAQFGLLLRDSEHRGSASFRSVEKLALEATGVDRYGYRAEFLSLVRLAESVSARSVEAD